MKELHARAVVAGLGTGGTAAVLKLLERGIDVIAFEESDEPGGQLTSQLVPPDENAQIETHHSTERYRDFRNRIRKYYRDNFNLSEKAKNDPKLNPGGGSVSELCFEPRVGVAVLKEMFAEAAHKSGAVLTVLYNTKIEYVESSSDKINSINVFCTDTNENYALHAPFFIDCTELGELVKLSGAEYVSGAESIYDTGEPHAVHGPAEVDNVQAFTWCLAVGCDRKGGHHIINKPEMYDVFRSLVPDMTPPWSGNLLSFNYTRPFDLQTASSYLGIPGKAHGEGYDFWRYRKVRCASNFAEPVDEVTIMNWPQNDYFMGNIIDKFSDERAFHLKASRELSLSMLYFLQTEMDFPQLYPACDVSGTPDGLAKMPYIRESRRIKALFTVSELHVGYQARIERGFDGAQHFEDSIGTGSYRIDLHPSSNGKNYIDIASFPFEIPRRALIPIRLKNLLAGAKNIGTTHISNGCFRLHPVEWTIGEGAGNYLADLLEHRENDVKARAFS